MQSNVGIFTDSFMKSFNETYSLTPLSEEACPDIELKSSMLKSLWAYCAKIKSPKYGPDWSHECLVFLNNFCADPHEIFRQDINVRDMITFWDAVLFNNEEGQKWWESDEVNALKFNVSGIYDELRIIKSELISYV